MQPYELLQLKKKRQQQERIIKNWFGDFAVTSEITITEPKQIHAICTLNPLSVSIFERASKTNADVILGFNIDDECMNKFWLGSNNGFIYL